jgi:hypothetical protein
MTWKQIERLKDFRVDSNLSIPSGEKLEPFLLNDRDVRYERALRPTAACDGIGEPPDPPLMIT